MGTRTADYTEYIDITTGTVRRKRTGMLLRDSEDIFIVDPNITIPKNKQTNFLSKIQNDLTINSEKPYYFAKTSLQPISKPSTEQLEYFTNAENFSLSPTNTLAPITFLKSKAKLPEDKQLTVKNKDSLTAEAIITVESPEIVVITERGIDQSSQILKPKSDLKQGPKPPGAKTEIAIEAPLERIENEIVEFNKKDLLGNEVKQRHEEQKEKHEFVEELAQVKERRKKLELEVLARQEERRKSLELEELAQVEEQRKKLELEVLARQEERRKSLELEELAQVEERRKKLELEELAQVEEQRKKLELEELAQVEEQRKKLELEELAQVEEQRKKLELEELAQVEEQRKKLELEELAQVEERRKKLELEELAQVEERRKKLELEELARQEERRKSLKLEELAQVEERRKSLELEELAQVEERRKSLELEELAQVEERRKKLELEELARQEERRKSLELEELAQVEERRKSLEQERRDREAEKHRLELERLAKEEEARTKQKKLKEYYEKHNSEVLARTERQKQEEERQKQERLQKFKEYHEQQVRKILFQLERQKKLEKQRLDREELEKLKARSLLDDLKEGIVLLELAQKQAAKKLLPAGVFFKEHPLVREAKNQLGLQKEALEKGVIPKLGKLEELIRGITRTAEVITLETERLSQAEAERVKFKFAHKIKEPLKVEKTFFQKLKEKFSGCFSANDIEPKPKIIEMVSVLHSKMQDNEIPIDPLGEQARIINPDEII
ncbi:MAG: hypothetical protein H6910_00660 [Rickettsiaceae bacterium]|nr:hypothetical protein [Rickettsiaceae bacterium]